MLNWLIKVYLSFLILLSGFDVLFAHEKLFYIYEWPQYIDDVWPPQGATLHNKSAYSPDFRAFNGAGVLLDEKVGLYRWMAVLVGFLGIIFITEPGFSALNVYYIYPIIFCLGLSYVAIAIRKLSSTEPAWLISFFFSFSIMLLSFLSFYQGWILPSLLDLFLLSMVGILGGLANLWLSQSYKYSEVSLVSPLKYLGLVFAIIFGYFIWNEIPTIKSLVGAFLVIISTLIIFRREIYKKKIITSRPIND